MIGDIYIWLSEHPKHINSFGLFCDIIGATLVSMEVVKQYRGYKHKPITERKWNEKDPETQDYKLWQQSKYKSMKIGLFFLILGFILQILSNHI